MKDDEILTRYVKEKTTKQINSLFLMKINEEMLKAKPSTDCKNKFEVFEKNDKIISDDLNWQTSKLKCKVQQRRVYSILKGLLMRESGEIHKERV